MSSAAPGVALLVTLLRAAGGGGCQDGAARGGREPGRAHKGGAAAVARRRGLRGRRRGSRLARAVKPPRLFFELELVLILPIFLVVFLYHNLMLFLQLVV